jgi:hypothetical protein
MNNILKTLENILYIFYFLLLFVYMLYLIFLYSIIYICIINWKEVIFSKENKIFFNNSYGKIKKMI